MTLNNYRFLPGLVLLAALPGPLPAQILHPPFPPATQAEVDARRIHYKFVAPDTLPGGVSNVLITLVGTNFVTVATTAITNVLAGSNATVQIANQTATVNAIVPGQTNIDYRAVTNAPWVTNAGDVFIITNIYVTNITIGGSSTNLNLNPNQYVETSASQVLQSTLNAARWTNLPLASLAWPANSCTRPAMAACIPARR
jgi:hypothetical protein